MSEETTWIEFEAWMYDISIQGYMALDEADDDAPLNFYDWNGLECGSHITNTRYPSFSESQLVRWETLVDWFKYTDVVQHLVDFADDEKILYFKTETDWGKVYDVELYINCSKSIAKELMVEDKSTTIRVKQSTKDILSQFGAKGMSYDDIIMRLFHQYNLKNIESHMKGKSIGIDNESVVYHCFKDLHIIMPKNCTLTKFRKCCEEATNDELDEKCRKLTGHSLTSCDIVVNAYCLMWDLPIPTLSYFWKM